MKELDRDKAIKWLEKKREENKVTATHNRLDAGYHLAICDVIFKILDGDFDKDVTQFEVLNDIISEEMLTAHETMLQNYPDALPTYDTLKQYIANIRLLKFQNEMLQSFIIVKDDKGA